MSLRTKSLLMISTTLAGMTVILLLAAAYILTPAFDRLEQSSVREKLHRGIADLSEDQARLVQIAQDYAWSDETYAFLANHPTGSELTAYIDKTFPKEMYLRHRISLVAVTDGSGKLVYGGEFDFNQQEIYPLPDNFVDQLPGGNGSGSLLSLAEAQSPQPGSSPSSAPTEVRLLRLADGPVLIAFQAVMNSSGQGPARGVLIFGRSLASELDKLSSLTGLNITSVAWDTAPAPDKSVSETIRPIDDQTIAGTTLLLNISGGPDTLLKVETSREIDHQGRASLQTLMIVLVGAGLGFIVITTLLLEKVILAPLAQIRTAISSIGASGEFDERLPVHGTDELSDLASAINGLLLEALEQRTEDLKKRLLQIRTAADVAQITTGRSDIASEDAPAEKANVWGIGKFSPSPGGQKRLLRQTIDLIVERFGYANASIYLLDPSRETAVLAETTGEGNNRFKVDTLKVPVGSRSMVGWVTANNQPRVAGNVNQDPYYLKDDFLPDIRSEAVIPISTGDVALGALDVQSNQPDAFPAGDIAVLQTLANQLATAIYNLRLLEATDFNLEEASLLSQASRNITQAESAEEVLRAVDRALNQTSYQYAVYTVQSTGLRKIYAADVSASSGKEAIPLSERLPVTSQELGAFLPEEIPYLIIDLPNASTLPLPLIHLVRKWQCETVALIPIKGESDQDRLLSTSQNAGDLGPVAHRPLEAIFLLGTQQRGALNPTTLQPYASLAEVTATALQKVKADARMKKSLAEVQTLNAVSQALALQTDLSTIYQEIHHAVRQFMGEVDFLVALLSSPAGSGVNPAAERGTAGSFPDGSASPGSQEAARFESPMIRIPYMWERGEFMHVEPIPLGEGLTSVVIHSRRPLRIIENAEEQARLLGAIVIGKPAKSWLGVPLMVGGEVIGAMVVQDIENELRFSEEDQRLLATLAVQVAAAIRNASILETTRLQVRRERTLREITSKIRNSAGMQTILETAATELGKALHANRMHIRAGLVNVPTTEPSLDDGHQNAEAHQNALAHQNEETSPDKSTDSQSIGVDDP